MVLTSIGYRRRAGVCVALECGPPARHPASCGVQGGMDFKEALASEHMALARPLVVEWAGCCRAAAAAAAVSVAGGEGAGSLL